MRHMKVKLKQNANIYEEPNQPASQAWSFFEFHIIAFNRHALSGLKSIVLAISVSNSKHNSKLPFHD